jgi:TRAP-type C4-dicarboxylate transport system permease small subunit
MGDVRRAGHHAVGALRLRFRRPVKWIRVYSVRCVCVFFLCRFSFGAHYYSL